MDRKLWEVLLIDPHALVSNSWNLGIKDCRNFQNLGEKTGEFSIRSILISSIVCIYTFCCHMLEQYTHHMFNHMNMLRRKKKKKLLEHPSHRRILTSTLSSKDSENLIQTVQQCRFLPAFNLDSLSTCSCFTDEWKTDCCSLQNSHIGFSQFIVCLVSLLLPITGTFCLVIVFQISLQAEVSTRDRYSNNFDVRIVSICIPKVNVRKLP